VKATEVTVGLAESNGSLLLGIWRDSLYVTFGLTACTPGSAPGPTLGNEYGKTYLYLSTVLHNFKHVPVYQRFARNWKSVIEAYAHAQPFNGPLSGTTRVSLYQKGKTNLDFTKARDSEWQWHQLGHMQVFTSLQTYT